MLSKQELVDLAAKHLKPPAFAQSESGVFRLQSGSQADVVLHSDVLLQHMPEISSAEVQDLLEELQDSTKRLLHDQNKLNKVTLVPVLRPAEEFEAYQYQPAGRPVTKPLWETHSQLEPAMDARIAIHICDIVSKTLFYLTPDHLKTWGISEEKAWGKAFSELDKHVPKNFWITFDINPNNIGTRALVLILPSSEGSICKIGPQLLGTTMLVKDASNIIHRATGRSATGAAMAMLLPRTLKWLARSLKCQPSELVIAPTHTNRLIISVCSSLPGLTMMHPYAQRHLQAWGFREGLTSTPLMLESSRTTPCTFKVYPHWGQQYSLAGARKPALPTVLHPYPLSERQYNALVKFCQQRKPPVLKTDKLLEEHRMGEVVHARDSMHETACFHCGKQRDGSKTFPRCSKCKHARFCSERCQTANWPLHKRFCRSNEEPAQQHVMREGPPASPGALPVFSPVKLFM